MSKDPANIVFGLVRDKTATDKKVSEELQGRKNIHIIEGDMTDYASLKKAADYTAEVTDGALDYLIANAALLSRWSAFHPIGVLYVDTLSDETYVLTSAQGEKSQKSLKKISFSCSRPTL